MRHYPRLTQLDFRAFQELAMKRAEATKAAGTTPPPGTRKAGESQYGTTMELAMRSSLGRQQAVFTLFPKDDNVVETPPSPSFLPASTAPPRLQAQREEVQEQGQEQGRGKRKRMGTVSYKEAREQGFMGSLGHSQTQHHA
jgi:hypothetical protein